MNRVADCLPLHAPRLLLRDIAEADFAAIHRYSSDPEVVRYLTWGPNTEEDTRRYVRWALGHQRGKPRLNFEFAVILQETGQFLGNCGIGVADPHNREAWIGYVFSREAWGHGYATEASLALLALGFEQLGVHRIIATCDPANVASARVLEKIGMQREGRLRQHKWARDRWRDSYLYGILEDEWERTRSADAYGVAE